MDRRKFLIGLAAVPAALALAAKARRTYSFKDCDCVLKPGTGRAVGTLPRDREGMPYAVIYLANCRVDFHKQKGECGLDVLRRASAWSTENGIILPVGRRESDAQLSVLGFETPGREES